MERYLRVNFLGPGPRLMKKSIYRAAVSQRLRNTGIEQASFVVLIMYFSKSVSCVLFSLTHRFRDSVTLFFDVSTGVLIIP